MEKSSPSMVSSRDNHELFLNLFNVVIPLAGKLDFPLEPPLSLPAPPDLHVISTKASMNMKMRSYYVEKVMNVKKKAYEEREAREAE